MNPHILKQVEAYLILRLADLAFDSTFQCQQEKDYQDALNLVVDAQIKMDDAFEIEWEKMKA